MTISEQAIEAGADALYATDRLRKETAREFSELVLTAAASHMEVKCTEDVARVALAECPIGLFTCGEELCLKTEYSSNEGRIDAYIVSSGEFFWGGAPQSIASQRATLVTPVDADARQPQEGEAARIVEHELGSIEVDARGSCKWTDVANAMTHVKAQLRRLSAAPASPQRAEGECYLIWSNEHRAWWRSDRCGYTILLAAAGRYTRDQAIKESRTRDQRPGKIMSEIPVRESDVIAAVVPAPPVIAEPKPIVAGGIPDSGGV